MNDFTKEELKFISDYIYLGIRDKKNHELLMRLDTKIQSMIDNYGEQRVMVRNEPRNIEEFIENCKHDWDDFEPNYCVKCKRVF